MATLVSSELDFINKNPNAKLSFGQIEHALQHIKVRERVSSAVTLGTSVLLMLALASVIGGGMFVVGALAAIALVGALYTLATREAESALRSKQINWMNDKSVTKQGMDEAASKPLINDRGFLGLNWFSKGNG